MSKLLTLGGVASLLLGAWLINESISPPNYTTAVFGVMLAVAGAIFLGRMRAKGRGQPLKVAFDFITIALLGIYLLSVFFGGLGGLIGKDQASLNLSLYLAGMTITGIVLAMVSGVFAVAQTVGKQAFNMQLVYIAATFAGFFFLNAVVPPAVPVPFQQSLATADRFVTVTISIPEEVLFRGWLAAWLGNVSHTGAIGGALGSAAIFTIYHLFVYGTVPRNLLIVFGAGAIAGFSALKTGRLSTTITTHLGNNFISASGVF